MKFTPGTSAPEFINLPATLLGFATSNLPFNATAAGTPVISYRVFRSATAQPRRRPNSEAMNARHT